MDDLEIKVQSHPFYSVFIDVEYLPGKFIYHVPVSLKFGDKKTAMRACRFIRRRYAEAHIAMLEN